MKTKISRFSVLSLAVVAMLVTINVQFTDPADAYEHILTIQNAADLEFPATHPANDPARAEFKLGIFPPDHHVPPAAPTRPPATPPAK